MVVLCLVCPLHNFIQREPGTYGSGIGTPSHAAGQEMDRLPVCLGDTGNSMVAVRNSAVGILLKLRLGSPIGGHSVLAPGCGLVHSRIVAFCFGASAGSHEIQPLGED